MNADQTERIRRARLSLEGLSIGDAFGEQFFRPAHIALPMISTRSTPVGPWRFTDDTAMALSVVEALQQHGAVVQDALADLFARRYARDPARGHGAMAHQILDAIAHGSPWHRESHSAFGGTGSMGNGAAMRAGPIGAYFFDDLELTAKQAQLSAEVTHAHPDGQAGAIAVAVAAACASDPNCTGEDLLKTVCDLTPEGPTLDGLLTAASFPLDNTADAAADALGNGSHLLSRDTVPACVWCAAKHLGNYAEGLWEGVSLLGDCDTNCAIVGSIIVLRDDGRSVPEEWAQSVSL